MITSIHSEKAFGKPQHPFTIKALIKPRIGGNFLDQVNDNYKQQKQKTQLTSYFTAENRKLH